jgi:hypothetical protein
MVCSPITLMDQMKEDNAPQSNPPEMGRAGARTTLPVGAPQDLLEKTLR